MIRGRDGFTVHYVELPEHREADSDRSANQELDSRAEALGLDYDYDTKLFAQTQAANNPPS